MKKLDLRESYNIPCLAWCAQIENGEKTVIVYHGSLVEASQNTFFEGAWSDEYSDYDFASALTFTGTGACLTKSGVLFAAPTNTLQPIFLINMGNKIICSNSVAFLLVVCADDVDINYRNYDFDMMSIMFGLKKYTRSIPTQNGNKISIYYYCNVLIKDNLQVLELKKKEPEPFQNYEEYRSFLCNEISLVVKNAAAPSRKSGYIPLAAISSGYDSPACAVFAKDAGCNEAVTFTTSRANFEDQNDSGEKIAALLELKCSEHDPDAYLRLNNFPETEFAASGTGGDDVYMACLENMLSGRLLFTGDGARVWELKNSDVGPDIIRRDPSGCSTNEFRLRVGYLSFPVPYIGCIQHQAIFNISNSSEMQPWLIENTTYNKPIPRRIVEEAGVPRELFGQKKKAVARPYHMTTGKINPPIERIFSPASCEDFFEFVENIPLYKNFLEMFSFELLHRGYHFNRRLLGSKKFRTLCRSLKITLPDKPYIPWNFAKRRTIHCFVYHWGVRNIMQRYANYD